MNTQRTQTLLERLASLLRSEKRNALLQHGLQPVQFEALHYLSVCNRYSDTPMAVTDYLGQTKGTVSQTLKVLEKKGLLIKNADNKDKRVIHLAISGAGKKLVSKVTASPLLDDAFKKIHGSDALNEALTTLLTAIQHANQFRSFGQCASCCHNIKKSSTQYLCGLTKEALSQPETMLICREHKANS